MMIVIIPHSTEELKIIRFQKELIKDFNRDGCIFYAHQPLWIEIEGFSTDSKEELKELSKKIGHVTLSSLKNDDDEFFLQAEIEFEDKKLSGHLPLLHLYKGKISEKRTNKKCPVEELKIFRLGIPYQYTETTKSLSDFIWHKESKSKL